MLKQIENVLEKMDSRSNQNRKRIGEILGKYLENKIKLEEAYYDLLDEELIPMPQRCGMTSMIPVSREDEIRLKKKIDFYLQSKD